MLNPVNSLLLMAIALPLAPQPHTAFKIQPPAQLEVTQPEKTIRSMLDMQLQAWRHIQSSA